MSDSATPASLGFRMPAEWEPHVATWLTWPRPEGISFPGRYEPVPDAYAAFIRHLVTGEEFADARELAEVIAGPRRRDYHRCLAEKLLVYALGRGLEYFDAPAVDRIVEEMERDGGGFGSLVHAVCRSVPFRMRRPAASPENDR